MKITVFYDGSCPLCTREIARWRHAPFACDIEWLDITDNDRELLRRGIDPGKAMLELHTQTDSGEIYTSVESYALLLSQLPRWYLLGRFMSLPIIKPLLTHSYNGLTRLRLKLEGRWPQVCERCDKTSGEQ